MHFEADLLIVGGGINGCGIARDAAGRGLRVILVEKDDLAAATSSASSKMIHGGLRYLEQLEWRLVREALAEREVLLRAAPHLVHPLRFLMPHAEGLRPGWMIRAGLFLYDWLARRDTLPASRRVRFSEGALAGVLKPRFESGYAYFDCQVDDARLVLANAVAAAQTGAQIFTRTECLRAVRHGARWRAELKNSRGESVEVTAGALVNATGPWARTFLTHTVGAETGPQLKLVQGSHIVVPRLYDGTDAFILQNDDRRVIFVCPYQEHSLVGTTDVAAAGGIGTCEVSDAEIIYLCSAVNRYFGREIRPADVIWRYCGVRALVDDGSPDPARVTRDYVLHLHEEPGNAPVLSVFGGKLTTYRRLAERALEELAPWLPGMGKAWTGDALLPGGDVPESIDQQVRALATAYPILPPELVRALALRHGSRAKDVVADSASIADFGEHFGANLYAREVDYLIDHEWARRAEDVLWRRTKSGLQLTAAQCARVEQYVTGRAATL